MAPKFSLFTERNVVIFITLHGEEIRFGEKQPSDLRQSCAQPSICSPLIHSTVSKHSASWQWMPYQTVWMHRLIWAFAVHICLKTRVRMACILTFTTLWENSVADRLMIFYYFSQEEQCVWNDKAFFLNISYKKNISRCHLSNFLPSMLRVNI